MNKTIKAKWVKALRSGRYRQAMGFLELRGSYCCLGVLCRVMKAEKDAYGSFYWGEDEGYAVLPEALRKEVKIPPRTQGRLASMNDGGERFKDIAAYIEKKL